MTRKTNSNEEINEENVRELRLIFDTVRGKRDKIGFPDLLEKLRQAGIRETDARLKHLQSDKKQEFEQMTFQAFQNFLGEEKNALLKRALLNQLIIPDFSGFCKDIEKYFKNTAKIKDGEAENAEKAALYAVSVCTVDGQMYQLGDHDQVFELQSVSKAVNYVIALHESGEQKVHTHVGREPSGRGYNGLVLNEDGLPHNPMINAGAIIVCSLIKPEQTIASRIKHVENTWTRLCGNTPVRFDNKKAKKIQTSDQNMALSYYMKEQGAFPEGADLYDVIEFYGKCCSIDITVDQLAMAAASLANGGTCPATQEEVFRPDNVRDCLSLMLSCGMYDYSGEFAFLVGLPAKSGVSGAMMLVVPGIMGIAIYSPPLDKLGNPVRGIAFCKALIKEYSLHQFDHIAEPAHDKKDPRRPSLK